jgi:hypothetical protein
MVSFSLRSHNVFISCFSLPCDSTNLSSPSYNCSATMMDCLKVFHVGMTVIWQYHSNFIRTYVQMLHNVRRQLLICFFALEANTKHNMMKENKRNQCYVESMHRNYEVTAEVIEWRQQWTIYNANSYACDPLLSTLNHWCVYISMWTTVDHLQC